jgi:hypothetical protein
MMPHSIETANLVPTTDSILSLFTRLNRNTSIYVPDPKFQHEGSDTDPTTILFFAWTDASPIHFLKYIQKYMTVFPAARIILARISIQEFMSPNETHRRKVMQPVLLALLPSTDPSAKKERILFHGFSNGGMKRLWSLITIYQRRTGKPLPVQLEVYDSCPGVSGRWQRDYGVLTRRLPPSFLGRLFMQFVGATITTTLWVLFHWTPFWQSFYKKPLKDLNDTNFIAQDSRRLYIYSKEDKVIHWKDVETHADGWADKGMAVEKVCVAGTQHCAHAKGENWDKYWILVLGAWKRSQVPG